MDKKFVIAIDGPAASGKSTTAKLIAEKLGYLYIDTGAMYRALTLAVLDQKIDSKNEKAINDLAKEIKIDLNMIDGEIETFLNDRNVSKEIRLPKITEIISIISAYEKVRKIMVEKQRELATEGGIVMDGRDIGTVVLPDADVKIFMEASVERRTQRRYEELKAKGLSININKIRQDIIQRDHIDSNRDISPLKPASDAKVIDTSDLTIDEQVQHVLNIINEMMEIK